MNKFNENTSKNYVSAGSWKEQRTFVKIYNSSIYIKVVNPVAIQCEAAERAIIVEPNE